MGKTLEWGNYRDRLVTLLRKQTKKSGIQGGRGFRGAYSTECVEPKFWLGGSLALQIHYVRRNRHNFCLPDNASARISLFVYSNTLPVVIPRAKRVNETGNSASKLEMYNAVPSPSTVGLVAMMTS